MSTAILVGHVVVEVRPMNHLELYDEGWTDELGGGTRAWADGYRQVTDKPLTLVFDDGTRVFAARNENGEGPGAFFGRRENDEGFRVVEEKQPARVSDRNMPLVWSTTHDPGDITLTVENYCKWYSLFLVHPDGRVEQIPFPGEGYCKSDESPYADHVPNPVVVQRFAERHGYVIDERAFEVMVGRWHLEAKHEDETIYGGDVVEEDEVAQR
jgi:hypothetical protein